jgi:hypothetical protein
MEITAMSVTSEPRTAGTASDLIRSKLDHRLTTRRRRPGDARAGQDPPASTPGQCKGERFALARSCKDGAVIKDKLQLLMSAAREKEASALVPYVDGSTPSDSGHWSARDNLAHLAAWRLFAAAEIDAVRTGVASPGLTGETEDQENARIYETTRDQTAAEVRKTADRSWAELAAAIEACSEEDLEKPRPRRPGQRIWETIPGNTYFHIAEHLGWWNTERGDDLAAEDAAKWAHDLVIGVFPEESSRGNADYNLGCFYAARGRAVEAIPYLRSGLELNPLLREWARQDSDLAPIRSSTELANLLADPADR